MSCFWLQTFSDCFLTLGNNFSWNFDFSQDFAHWKKKLKFFKTVFGLNWKIGRNKFKTGAFTILLNPLKWRRSINVYTNIDFLKVQINKLNKLTHKLQVFIESKLFSSSLSIIFQKNSMLLNLIIIINTVFIHIMTTFITFFLGLY